MNNGLNKQSRDLEPYGNYSFSGIQSRRLPSASMVRVSVDTTIDRTRVEESRFYPTTFQHAPGLTWVTQVEPTAWAAGIYYANNLWVIFGQNGILRTSTDLITWTTQTSNFTTAQTIQTVYNNGSVWVAGGTSGQLRTSTDLITWVTQTSNFGNSTIRSVNWGNNLWVAGGDSGQLRTSTDGITWTTRTSNFGVNQINSITYGDSKWVAVGGAQVRTSTDAITWVTQTSNFGSTSFNRVAYNNSLWVAVGNSGQIRTSTDAITWVTRTSNFTVITQHITGLSYGSGVWLYTGSAGSSTSRDGITWITQLNALGFVEFANNVFAGTSGTIMTCNPMKMRVGMPENFPSHALNAYLNTRNI